MPHEVGTLKINWNIVASYFWHFVMAKWKLERARASKAACHGVTQRTRARYFEISVMSSTTFPLLFMCSLKRKRCLTQICLILLSFLLLFSCYLGFLIFVCLAFGMGILK